MYSSSYKIRKILNKNSYDNFKNHKERSQEVDFVYHLTDEGIHIKRLHASGDDKVVINKKKLLPEDHPNFFQALIARALEKIRKRKRDQFLLGLSGIALLLGGPAAVWILIFMTFSIVPLVPVSGALILPSLLLPAFIYGLKQIHHDTEKSRGRGFLLTASSGTLMGLGIGIALALLGVIPGGILAGACIGIVGGLMVSSLIGALMNSFTMKVNQPVDQSEEALSRMEITLLPTLQPVKQEKTAFFARDYYKEASVSVDEKKPDTYEWCPTGFNHIL